jgi:thioredoxin 2
MANAAGEIVRCVACGASNRVVPERLAGGVTAVCGRCKAPLTGKSEPLVVSDATLGDLVEHSPLPVLVDLWAPWCGPCRMIAPAIDKLAAQMAGRVRFTKLNIDENPGIAQRFRVDSIPTLLIMNRGREIDRLVGVHPFAKIKDHLERIAG